MFRYKDELVEGTVGCVDGPGLKGGNGQFSSGFGEHGRRDLVRGRASKYSN